MSGITNRTNSSNDTMDSFLCMNNLEGVWFWACTIVISFILGFPAAVSVLWEIIQRGRKGRHFTPYHIFVFNSTLIDGLFLFIVLPDLYNYLHGHNVTFEYVMFFMLPMNMCGKPLFTSCICVDCYLAVVHPVVYKAHRGLTPRVLIAAAIWTLTLVLGFPYAIYNNVIDKAVEISFFTLALPIIGFCDVTIFWTLRRSNPAGGAVHPRKKKAQQIIINNLVITFTSYLPSVVGALMSKILNMDELTTVCYILFISYATISVVNTISPILYLNNLGKLDWLKCVLQK